MSSFASFLSLFSTIHHPSLSNACTKKKSMHSTVVYCTASFSLSLPNISNESDIYYLPPDFFSYVDFRLALRQIQLSADLEPVHFWGSPAVFNAIASKEALLASYNVGWRVCPESQHSYNGWETVSSFGQRLRLLCIIGRGLRALVHTFPPPVTLFFFK